MTDLDSTLDALCAAQDREDWLAARNAGFGCSDLGALWLILGWVGEDQCDWHEVPAVDGKGKPTTKWVSNLYRKHQQTGEKDYSTPRYLWEAALPMKKTGLPRLIAEKAGLAKPKASSDAQEEGKAKERALFEQSRLGRFDVESRYAPDGLVLPGWRANGQVVSENPTVLRDTEEPHLFSTIEAWEWVSGKGVVAWELKTDRLGLRTKPPWAQRLQAIGQAVVMGAEAWGLIYGPEWAKTDRPSFPDLRDPVQFGPYEVKDSDRKMIRQAVGAGWDLVLKARER